MTSYLCFKRAPNANFALRVLRAVSHPVEQKLFAPVARAEKDYATHLPILIGLARAMRIQTVLELGCGMYSTLAFLNRKAFPALARLDSLETDQSWLDKISKAVGDDPRFHAQSVSTDMHVMVERTYLEQYDLIFIDDSTNSEKRSATIRAVSKRQLRHPVVAIHDFEVKAYQQAARTFRHRFIFKAFNPQTGVVWDGGSNLRRQLEKSASVMKHCANKLEPDNIEEWRLALSR